MENLKKIIYVSCFMPLIVMANDMGSNLVFNGDASKGKEGWTINGKTLDIGNKYNIDKTMGNYFYGGKEKSSFASQDINISGLVGRNFELSAYQNALYGNDKSEVKVIFLDLNGRNIQTNSLGLQTGYKDDKFKKYILKNEIPLNAVKAKIVMNFFLYKGTYCNSYVDNIVFKVKKEKKALAKEVKKVSVEIKTVESINVKDDFSEYRKVPISLDKIVNDIIKQNANILLYKIQNNISKHKIEYEKGVTDTIFSFSLKHKDVHVPNGIEDILAQYQAEYKETLTTFDMSLNGVSSYGTQWNAKIIKNEKYSSVMRKNNASREYTNNFDITIKQPILRNFGTQSTLIKVDIAKMNHKIAMNEYKKNMMDLVGMTIQLYWKLYGLQEIHKSWKSTLKIANQQLKDIEVKVQSGRLSNTHLLTIKAAISLRKIEIESAKSKILQIQNKILTLLNLSSSENKNILFVATDSPNIQNIDIPSLKTVFTDTVEYWPQFENIKNKIKLSKLKLDYADNQTLPNLDILGNINTSSLDKSNDGSWKQVSTDEFLSWYVGLEFSRSISNTYSEENKKIEKLKLLKLKYEYMSLLRKINNDLSEKISKVLLTKNQMAEYIKGMKIQKELIDIKSLQLKFGKITFKDVLEEEEKFISFQRKFLNNIVELKLSNALLEKATGKLLNRFKIEIVEDNNHTFNEDKIYD